MYIGRGNDAISNVEKLDNITFNGGTTYALTKSSAAFTPVGANNILLSMDGVIQAGNFTVSGTNIVFTGFSPTSSNTCDFILHYGTGVLNVPADGAVSTAKLAADSVTGAKIADDQIDSEHYADGSIDTAHLGNLQVTTAKIAADAIDGTKLADDAVDSEHYTDASIDNAHLADDAVGVAELSATGTASSSTFLRGDNAWAAAGGGKILQVVKTCLANSASSTSNSYATILTSSSITLNSASNSLLCIVNFNYTIRGNSSVTTPEAYLQLQKADGTTLATHMLYMSNLGTSTSCRIDASGCIIGIYSPATTTEAPRVQYKADQGLFEIKGVDGVSSSVSVSCITVMEIEA